MFELIVGIILLGMFVWFIAALKEAKNTPRLRKHMRNRNKNDYWKRF